MGSEKALTLLCQQSSWEEFAALASTMAAESEMDVISSLTPITVRKIPQQKQDTR